MSLDENGSISGDGLRIGGEGMKGFYDQILPRFMDKYGKKWGVKTGEVELSTPGREVMHSVDVTGAMKRSVLSEGQPLFQREPAGNGERVKGNDIAIDDRVAQREYLLSDNYVASLTGDEFAKSDEPLTERVAQFYAENYGGEVEREGVGVVVLDKRGVKDSISHGVGRNKAAAFAAVPDIIRDGVLVDQKKNWKNRNYDSYTIAAPVEIAGEGFVGVAIVTRGHGTNINKFYLHEVVLQKNLHDESIKTDTKADSHRGDVAKVLREIVTAKENSGNNSETIVNGGVETYTAGGGVDLGKLDERQREQVRSAAFKDWFGDWEKAAKLAQINQLEALSLTEENYTDDEIENVYKSLPNGVNKHDGRVVEFVNKSLGKILNHKGFDYKLVVPRLKDIYDNSIPIISEKEEIKEGHKVHSNFEGYHHYLGKVSLGEAEYYVRITVQELHTNPSKKKAEGFTPNQFHSAHISDVQIYSAGQRPVNSQIINRATDNATGTKIDAKLQQFLESARESAKNSSKVVDENGVPLVVYHQTNNKQYVSRSTGRKWDDLDWRERDEWENRSDEEWNDEWVEEDFYTFDNRYGRQSIEYPAFFVSPVYDEYHEYGNRTIAVYLNIKNPAIDPEIPEAGVTNTAGRDAMEALIAQGYDGVIRTENGVPYEYIAFRPEQIKSADENVGTFDDGNPDIRYRDGAESGLLRDDAAALGAARERVLELAERLGLDVVIVDDMSADERRRLTERQRRARGMYGMSSGRVYVNLGNHRTAEDALLTALHEGVAHHGLRALFGERFDAMLEQVYREASPETRAAIDEKLSAIREERARQQGGSLTSGEERAALLEAVDETLADVAEDMGRNDEFSRPWYRQLWESVKQALRDVARAVGLRHELSEGELRYMLWSSYHNLEREAARKGRTIAQAQDIAARERYGVAQRDEQWREKGIAIKSIDWKTYNYNLDTPRSDEELKEYIVSLKRQLQLSNTIQTINSADVIYGLKDFIEEGLYKSLLKSFSNSKVRGGYDEMTGSVFIFTDRINTYRLIGHSIAHEVGHHAYEQLSIANKEARALEALEWLKGKVADREELEKNLSHYKKEELPSESTARVLAYLYDEYGFENMFNPVVVDNENVRKFVAELSKFYNNGSKQENNNAIGRRRDSAYTSRGVRPASGEGTAASAGESRPNGSGRSENVGQDGRREEGSSPIGEDIRYRDGAGDERYEVDDRAREGDVVRGVNLDAAGNVTASWQGVVRRVFDNGAIELDGGVQYSRRMLDVYFGRASAPSRGAHSVLTSIERGGKTVVSQEAYDSMPEVEPAVGVDSYDGEAVGESEAATREEREELVDALSSWPVRGYSEALVDALAREASDHRENVEARRSALHEISKELHSWRERAARVQREFDRATVDRLVSLARAMLTANALNGLTRGEVKRLLSVINRSVGAKDLTEAVNTVAAVCQLIRLQLMFLAKRKRSWRAMMVPSGDCNSKSRSSRRCAASRASCRTMPSAARLAILRLNAIPLC